MDLDLQKLEDRLTNLFLQKSKIDLFSEVIPVVFDIARGCCTTERLMEEAEYIVKTVLSNCRMQGKEFIVYPKFSLGNIDNTIMSVTDFIYEEFVMPAASGIKFDISYEEE